MDWTERYVRDDATGGGDGTTNASSGINGAWTLTEAIARFNQSRISNSYVLDEAIARLKQLRINNSSEWIR